MDPQLQGLGIQLADVAVRNTAAELKKQEAACEGLVDALVPILDEDPTDLELQMAITWELDHLLPGDLYAAAAAMA